MNDYNDERANDDDLAHLRLKLAARRSAGVGKCWPTDRAMTRLFI